MVDEGGIVLDVDTASKAAAGFVSGQEWPSFVAATDVKPAAFVLKGINWSDQAPESVVKAARVASQALEKRKEALTKALAKNRAFHTLKKDIKTEDLRRGPRRFARSVLQNEKMFRGGRRRPRRRRRRSHNCLSHFIIWLIGASVFHGIKSQQWRAAELPHRCIYRGRRASTYSDEWPLTSRYSQARHRRIK